MKIFYVNNKQPKSYNHGGSSEQYKHTLKSDFNKKYASIYNGLPITKDTLQAHIVYIHQRHTGNIPDVDNISKPIIDSFIGVIYDDDSLIIRRTADIIKLNDFDFLSIDATNIPIEVYNDFEMYIEHKEKDIVFFEVGNFNYSFIKIGEI